MVSRCRCVVYYSWQKLRTNSLHGVTRSGYFSGRVTRTGVTFQTQCNNAATRGEIAFCQKWEPLHCRKCPSSIPCTQAAPLHRSVALRTLDCIQVTSLHYKTVLYMSIRLVLIYSNGDSLCLVVSYLTQRGCCSWWDCRQVALFDWKRCKPTQEIRRVWQSCGH